ncbi:hypothetical protein MUP01_01115 [Candidatus Bathyarchaeota archaeon]|nr:hypothetical protein [Candidatus Bathyarchaeota archaeon]
MLKYASSLAMTSSLTLLVSESYKGSKAIRESTARNVKEIAETRAILLIVFILEYWATLV